VSAAGGLMQLRTVACDLTISRARGIVSAIASGGE
jgi:hypothetical protein